MKTIILYNARIHTLDPAHPQATALCIRSAHPDERFRGHVLAVGDDAALLETFSLSATTLDMEGRAIIPGLTDAHFHLEGYARSLQKVPCETPTRQACLQRVAERAADTPPGQWILGHGWNQTIWAEGFGDPSDLDAVAPQHPVYLTAKSLHAGWANGLALQAAGIGPGTPDPPGGRLSRDSQGHPTGFLFEDAMQLVARAIPEPDPAQVVQAIREALPGLWKLGLTGLHDFDRQRSFTALQQLRADHELGVRVVKSIPLEDLPHAIALGLRSGFGDEVLRIGAVKAFADGALGPRTAAMLQPYQNTEGDGNMGMLLIDGEQLYEHAQQATRHGLSMAVHAIGDRANHEVLWAFEQLRAFEQEHGLPPLRHRIEHVQVLHPDDLPRLARAGIIASMQPIHATSDMLMADHYWGARSDHAYAWRELLDRGTRLAFGSDAPVESPNPFWGIHAAVTRQRADGSPGPQGWYPRQRLTLAEALAAYTHGAAYAAGREDHLGRLAPGYLADLLVLEADPFACPPEALRDMRPQATMVGGEWVYSELTSGA